jgi:voltage-gated potassium channel Kch
MTGKAALGPSKWATFRRFLWQRLRPAWVIFRWPLIGALALVTVGFGYWGFDLSPVAGHRSVADKLYLALQLFGLQSGAIEGGVAWPLQTARFLAPLVTLSAAATAIATIFRDQLGRARVRWFARRHVLVCGLGRTGTVLASAFRQRSYEVVAIEQDEQNASVAALRQDGGTVLVGNATDRILLETARVDRARYLFAVCGDDGVNAQLAIAASEVIRAAPGRSVTCFVEVVDADLAALLQSELATADQGRFRLEFFNPAELGAAALLNEHPPFDDEGATPFGPPHLIVVGLGEMGSRLVLHGAQRWATLVGSAGTRFRVTVVDRQASRNVGRLLARHPHLEQVCEVVPYQADVDSPEFEQGGFLSDEAGGWDATAVYVCLSDDARGLAAALRLHHRLKPSGIPIVVRTKQHGGLAALVERVGAGGIYDNIHIFGLLDRTCRPDRILMTANERLARAIHDEYLRNQAAAGDTPETNRSVRPWDELDEETRDSNRHQAADIRRKLAEIGCDVEPITDWHPNPFEFSPEELKHLSRMEHERWWREKEAAGWKLGAVKDRQRHEHPDMVPWKELSEGAQEKDRQAVRYIPALLAKAGLRVVRLGPEDGRSSPARAPASGT